MADFSKLNGYNVKDAKARQDNPFVSVKSYGAKGDGVTDDTQAIKDALADNNNLYFPEGTYLVSETIEMTSQKNLCGDGSHKSILLYKGNDYLFNIKTEFDFVRIDKLGFKSTTSNSFLKCESGTWGGNFEITDFLVEGFDIVFHFVSAFGCVIQRGYIKSQGKSIFTTDDPVEDGTNFSNCVYFENVYFTRKTTSSPLIEVLFDFKHVRDISFHKCQLECAELLFKNTSGVKDLHLHNCWIENVECIYDFDDLADPPTLNRCRLVNVTKYSNAQYFDYVFGIDRVKVYNGTTRTHSDMRNREEITFIQREMFNENDTYKKYFYPVKITSHDALFNMPINVLTKEESNVTSVSYDLLHLTHYSDVNGLFNILVLCYFDDGSVKIHNVETLSYRKKFYKTKNEEVFAHNWGVSKTSTITTSLSEEGTFRVSSDTNMKKCVVMINYNFNHSKGQM